MKFFIHIPKTGGMTIRHSPQLKSKILVATRDKHKSKQYSDNLLNCMNKLGDHHGYEHARWRDLHPQYQKMTAFAAVRNPWSKVVSRYLFAKQVIEILCKVPKNYADIRSLEHFIEERHKWGDVAFMWHRAVRCWYPQLDHVTDTSGTVRCDIMRTEFLNTDICSYFRISELSGRRNVTVIKKNYKELYSTKTIQTIADWYKDDIEYFGFDFDTAAQKNCYVNSKY